tara:strand:- start:18704 stop:18964 length:261 start_codon:yes stop_codon:yes gene_type:complete
MIQKKLFKMLILTDVYIQEIEDDTLEMNDITKAVNIKLKEVNELLLPILDKFYDNNVKLSRSTISQDVQKKLNYNIDRVLKAHKCY